MQGDGEDDECFCGVCKVKYGTELELKVWGLSVVIVKLGIVPLVWRWKIIFQMFLCLLNALEREEMTEFVKISCSEFDVS